jgi:lipoprotein-anchoring transpeptidase ErfK/SrfK
MGHDIADLLQSGKVAAHSGRRADAQQKFRGVLALDPTNVPAHLWLAWLSENPSVSLDHIAQALACDPDNAEAHAALRWAQGHAALPSAQDSRSASIQAAFSSSDTEDKIPATGTDTRPGLWVVLGVLTILIGIALTGSLPKNTPALADLAPTLTPMSTPVSISGPVSTHTPAPTSPVRSDPTSTRRPTALSSPAPAPSPSPLPSRQHTPTPSPVPILPTPPPLPPSLTPAPLSIPSGDIRWIDIDLTNQQLAAYEGQKLMRLTPVSTGLPRTPTPTGQYHIQIKLRYDDMSGIGYYLPNVPYVMYFHGGYGIHGTYWHARFGQPMSHGCVNIPTEVAEWLFDWATVGTMVNIHH